MTDRKEETISSLRTLLNDWRHERGWVAGRGDSNVVTTLVRAAMEELGMHCAVSSEVEQGKSRLWIPETSYQQYVLADVKP